MDGKDTSDQVTGAEDREPRWRRQPEAKRQRLIEATITVLARDGLSDFSLERVAGEAELSAGLVRHHFGGRAGLLCAAYQKIAEHFLEAIDHALENEPQGSIERLKAYLDVVQDPFAIGYEPASAWFALWNEARDDKELHDINRGFQAQYLERISTLVRDLAGDWSEADIAIEARSLIALTDGLWQERMIDPDAQSREISHEVCSRYLVRLLAALKNPAACALTA
jgi:AcrR family transcriptional regulator